MVPRQRRRIEDRRPSRGNSGYTLVEFMVAMLLASIMFTSIFSVALTVKTGGVKGESKLKSGAMARQVGAMLKNYVTGETTTTGTTLIPGPCPSNLTNSWSMTCGAITDACEGPGIPNCYALADGTHTLTGINTEFEAAPTGAR